jgi:hypothetical protein
VVVAATRDRERVRSDSLEQRAAEPLILAGASKAFDAEPASKSTVAADESILVEVYAHQGRLTGAQFHKVARDALKLATLGRSRPNRAAGHRVRLR